MGSETSHVSSKKIYREKEREGEKERGKEKKTGTQAAQLAVSQADNTVLISHLGQLEEKD